ncbi:MAG: 2-amino-4-hydroxy-6-hydroxymethyldihydropteridine diphosphokinase [Bacteroidaceae bacterium]|nr:2-amino-4-hydroxy-6-hydroxymethyldihydropteridine diphosphokinase [Bacteroidaceae bacterium]
MNHHFCLLCLGSNSNRHFHMEAARKALMELFPNIRFSTEMTTEAIGDKFLSPFSNQVAKIETPLTREEIRSLLKKIEKENGRLPEDKEQGIVKLDIDLLTFDDLILKPNDLEKDFVIKGISSLQS